MNFFLVFHHNLAFSSIPYEHYGYIVDVVYDGLLDIAEAGIPLGLEYTGETLEILKKTRPEYIERLKRLHDAGLAEIIGSSFSQAIFPLIPAQVNRWNLSLGHKTYSQLLGTIPRIAYLNEQCYSESLPGLYKEAGYRAIICDWINAEKGNDWPAYYRYVPMVHNPSDVIILWSDCIAFQKIQRAVWQDISLSDFEDFIQLHIAKATRLGCNPAYLCLYCSDAEVFDYIPGCLKAESCKQGQIKRLAELVQRIADWPGVSFQLPGKIINNLAPEKLPKINRISTADYPIRTKKQEKYNVTRWAITGREATKMNTQCFRLLNSIREIEAGSDIADTETNLLRNNLVKLWGSDYRTHTIDEKYEEFRNIMGESLAKVQKMKALGIREKSKRPLRGEKSSDSAETVTIDQDYFHFLVKTKNIELCLLKNKGLAIKRLSFRQIAKRPLIGTVSHGYFNDICLASDFFSGHTILVTQYGKQHTDLSCRIDEVAWWHEENKLIIQNHHPMQIPGLSLSKTFTIEQKGLRITYDFYARDLRPASLRMGIWTILPESFDRASLYYKTCLGGDKPETFYLSGKKVLQDQPVNHVVTARHCIGCTEGELAIGDDKKEIIITTDQSQLYSVPLFHYEETPCQWTGQNSFLCRAFYSICERDDVANVFWKGRLRLSFFIHARQQYGDLQTGLCDRIQGGPVRKGIGADKKKRLS